ncbi:MAG: hypothetical protein JNL67_15325 [Planctomycetaceae bacterium]|nr:hypothetical protein [Planctomycetaceae bacterium]
MIDSSSGQTWLKTGGKLAVEIRGIMRSPNFSTEHRSRRRARWLRFAVAVWICCGWTAVSAQDDSVRPSRVQTDGTVLMVDGLPFAVRAIEYNGEPMGMLRDLGFNTLWLNDVPSLDQLRLAKEHDLWVIAPPPTDNGPVPVDWQHEAVLAWLVGQDVNWMDQGTVRQRVDQIRRVDPQQGRPVLVRARNGLADYARFAEILCVGRPVVGTTFPLIEYGNWLRGQHEITQSYVPILAEIQTELPLTVAEQSSFLSGVNAPLALQYAQLRGQVFQAMTGGARGFLFRSRTRLDDGSDVSPQRRLNISLVNRQLLQVDPWIKASVVGAPLEQAESGVKVSILKTSLSRLLLVQQVSGRESYTAGAAERSVLTVRDSAAGTSEQPYRMTPNGLVPAAHQRLGGQMAIEIANASDWELLVLTQDPAVVRYVEQTSRAAHAWTTQQLLIEQAQATAEWSNRIFSAMLQAGREPAGLREQVLRINDLANLTQAESTSSDPSAVWASSVQLQRDVGAMHDALIREAHAMLPWPAGSPVVLHPILVPLHWQSLERLGRVSWLPNALPGGDFEDLGHLTNSGWQHQNAVGLSIRTLVQLHQDAMVDGRRGLLIAAQPDGGLAPKLVESAPVWIDSGSVDIPANQLVRINGHVRIDTPITASTEGLIIQESLGGAEMAQRFTATTGWQTFTIYRATNEPHKLRLNISLTGYGTAYVDELTVQFAPLPTPGNAAAPLANDVLQSAQQSDASRVPN